MKKFTGTPEGTWGQIKVEVTPEVIYALPKVHGVSAEHAWGYQGSGASETAYDLLYEALSESDESARTKICEENYIAYRDDTISKIPGNKSFVETEESIMAWLRGRSAVP